MLPEIQAFHDPVTGTVTYVVRDGVGGPALIIDPVLDYDPKSGRTSSAGADAVLAFLTQQSLTVEWILETHAHADHLSAAAWLKRRIGGRIGIGEHICEVQKIFGKILNLGDGLAHDGSQFDHLFADNETFSVGALTVRALFVPGHTPADLAYQIGDAVFVGDTMFMPDVGSARADFPGGDARRLYRSAHRLLALGDATRLFMCHDYPPDSRAPAWETTVRAQREHSIHLNDSVSEDAFVAMRSARDKTLGMPALILPSIQVNIRAGELPPAESNGTQYLKIPLNVL